MYYRYFSCGSESEKEGLTFFKFSYYDNGMLAAGIEDTKSMYKGKEISKEEYDRLTDLLKDPETKKGFAGGIVNEEGFKKYKNWVEKEVQKIQQRNEEKISFVVRKIKKQLELGIIIDEDIDTEIELNNMSQFRDEIKKRLEQ